MNEAKDLVNSLDDADKAQKKAKEAIQQANDDIALARADLELVNLPFTNSIVTSPISSIELIISS